MTSQDYAPHFLKVETTPGMREFLRACLEETEIGDKLEKETGEEIERVLSQEETDGTGEGKCEEFREELRFSSLERVFTLYKQREKLDSGYFAERGRVYLHELMRGSEVYFTPPKKPPRNPELVKRLAKIQQQLDNQKYDRMVSNLTERRSQHGSLAIDMKSLNIQSVHAFNILLSFVCAFAFGFTVGYLCELEHTYSAIIGVAVCVPVLLADVYFLLKSYEDGLDGLDRTEGVKQERGGVVTRRDKKHD